MDSRVKRHVVIAALLIIVVIISIVWIANEMQGTNTTGVVEEAFKEQLVVVNEDGLNPKRDPKAFLKDEDFFDPEVEKVEPAVQITLLVSSIEKDMRVNVIDGYGKLITGHKFKINLKDAKGNSSHYLDVDQDGSVYIAPIVEGTYEVSMDEVEGYITASSDASIEVKEQLDYTILDDISYLIKDENEVDGTVEDTAINEAQLEADGTESNKKLSEDNALFGIDVSKWNKTIDWDKVKESGVEFAIIRCGYRGSSTGALVEDPMFQKNIEGAKKAGIKVGIYFFTQAVNEAEAVEEASMAAMLCNDYELELPIFIDTEGAGGNGRADALEQEMRTKVCETFCHTLDNAGYQAGVYASKHWWQNNLDASALEDYTVWLAQYSKQATYDENYDLWQYTSAGTVDGIETRVDLNLCYKKY